MTTALCIILDVGSYMAVDLVEAINCLKLLLQKKFFSESKDEVALILCGTEATDNHLATNDQGFEHISMIFELSALNWDVLEFLNQDLLSRFEGDVFDALLVATDHLNEQCKNKKKIKEKRILLITNLCGSVENSKIIQVTETLRNNEINLSLLGVDLANTGPTDQYSSAPSSSSSNNENHYSANKLRFSLKAIKTVWDELEGESFIFADVISALNIFETRAVAQRGWKVEFQIGDAIKIPVDGFTQTKETRPSPLKLLYAPDPSVSIHTVTTYQSQDGDCSHLNPTDVIRGYRYGNTRVAFGNEDMEAVKPNSEKCLALIGFTDASNVPCHLYAGESVLVFVPSSKKVSKSENNDPSNSQALAALAQALYELNGVALVRRVYNRISAPRLGVLTPEIRNSQISLVYTDLAFAEDIRSFELPSLPLQQNLECEPSTSSSTTSKFKISKNAPSEEQLNAIDLFIDSMTFIHSDDDDVETDENDISNENSKDGCEETAKISGLDGSVKPERIPNPWIQRFFACLRERGLNPAAALPVNSFQSSSSTAWLSPDCFPGLDTIINQIIPNTSVTSSFVEKTRDKLVSVFPPLQPTTQSADSSDASVSKRRRLMASELFGLESENINGSSNTNTQNPMITSIGPIDPVQDFETLVSQRRTEFACRQMEFQIVQLVTDPFTASLLRPKAIACLQAYRNCAKSRHVISNSSGDYAISSDGDHMNRVNNISSSDTQMDQFSMALSYNTFIREWRQDLIDRNLLSRNTNLESLSEHSADPRLSFWIETITQGFGLLSDEDLLGIGVTHLESIRFANLEDLSDKEELKPKPTIEKIEEPSNDLKIDDLLDDMD